MDEYIYTIMSCNKIKKSKMNLALFINNIYDLEVNNNSKATNLVAIQNIFIAS